MRASSQYNKAKKNNNKIKSIQIVKDKVTLPVFTDNTIIYKENPVGSTTDPLELINEFNKIAKYKINTQNQFRFCILATIDWKVQLRKNPPLMTASKNKN